MRVMLCLILLPILTGCGGGSTTPASDMARLTSPTRGEKIESPLRLYGEARGYFFFEATFIIRLEDEKGKVLGEAPAYAQSSWMTDGVVPFESVLTFTAPEASAGVLILEAANPSGLEENAHSVRVPVRF